MVSLHGFSILILLTQSNHKSALLFSCTCPFSGACGYYTIFFLKSQTYVHIFLRKIKKFFRSYPQYRREKGGITNKTYRSSATKARPPRGKRRSASGSARTPFRGGPFCRCAFFLVPPVWERRFDCRLRGCVSVVFRRELVCGGAKPRRTRL